MGYLYHEIIYRPLANALVLLYNTVAGGDLGIAIILLTILVRIALYPLFHKSIEHNLKMQALQPKLKRLKDEHKGNKEKEVAATMELFREHQTNPLSLMFFTLAQLPLLIALYHLMSSGLNGDISATLYAWIMPPGEVNATFLGLINLREPNTILVALVALATFAQTMLSAPSAGSGSASGEKKEDREAQRTLRRNAVIGGGVIGIILAAYRIPSAVGLYLIASAVFSVFQQRAAKARMNYGKLA